MKLWTIKTNECIATYDQHEDKVLKIFFMFLIYSLYEECYKIYPPSLCTYKNTKCIVDIGPFNMRFQYNLVDLAELVSNSSFVSFPITNKIQIYRFGP